MFDERRAGSSLPTVAGLRTLAPRYDVLLCDVFGTLHDARGTFGPALDALARFRMTGGRVVLVSNSVLPAAALAASLAQRGIPRGQYDGIVTSADIARDYVREAGARAIFHLGPDADRSLYEGLTLALVGPDAADLVVCTGWPAGPCDPDAGDLAPRLEAAAQRGLELVCTNPDRSVTIAGGAVLRFAGLIAERYAALGGHVIATGKPDGRIYRAAIACARGGGTSDAPTDRMLAIGDGFDLDVGGALAAGIDALWVSPAAASAPAPGADKPAIVRIAALRW